MKVGTSKEQSKCNNNIYIFINLTYSGEFEYDLYLKNDYGTTGFI